MTRPHDKIGHDKTGQFFSIDIIIAFLAFILKYACSGIVTLTPSGT